MIKIKLNNGMEALVDREDKHLSAYKWHAFKKGNVVYAMRHSRYRGHRGGFGLHHAVIGKPIDKKVVDHINGNGLDNRRSNLRIVSQRVNLSNQVNRKIKKTSKYVGVSLDPKKKKKKWRACITINGKSTKLGYFTNQKIARKAYLNIFKKMELQNDK